MNRLNLNENNPYRESWKMTLFAFLLPLTLIALFRVFTFTVGDNSQDAYYHMRIAAEGPSVFMAKQFPNLTMSIWQEQFSDKEMLFHIILWILSIIPGLSAFSEYAPFSVYATVVSGLLLLSFVLVARSLGLKHLWIYSLGLLFISPIFLNRILMLRPHVIASALILISFAIFLRTDSLKKSWLCLAAGFVMAWAYSNPHFILFSACAVSVPCLIKGNYPRAFMIPTIALAGVALGYLLHPQFPNSFITWKVQCIDVVRESIGKPVIEIGAELSPAGGDWFMVNFLFCVLAYINYFLFVRNLEKSSLKKMQDDTLACAAVSLVTFSGIFFGQRAIEYSCPFNMLLCGLLIRDALQNGLFSALSFKKGATFAVLILLVAASLNFYWHKNVYDPRRIKEYKEVCTWVKEKSGIPPHTVIGNLDWSDFPQLYFGLPDYRFLSGMEPMFSYVRFPERMKMLEKFRTGQAWIPFEDLQTLLECRYLFLSEKYSKPAAVMKLRGAKVLYEGKDGTLFDLQESRKTPR